MSFTFPKEERLKRKKLFDALFRQGNSLNCYPIKLLYLKTPLPQDVKIKVGVTVPKRNFRKAVKRNRIKRLLREAYRLNKPLVFNNSEGNFAFLFLYIGKDLPVFKDVERSMIIVLKKFIQKEKQDSSEQLIP